MLNTMRRRSLTLTLLLFVLASVASAATDFTLDDQFRKSHTRADIFAGKPVIMLAGMERKTPDAMEAWDRALRAKALTTAGAIRWHVRQGYAGPEFLFSKDGTFSVRINAHERPLHLTSASGQRAERVRRRQPHNVLK